MAKVELQGVGRVFPGGVEALVGLDLAVEGGEFLAVVGPSGSGKSTLLRMIAGLEAPSAGSIWLEGRPADRVAPRDRDVAMVFQDPAPYPHLSVFDNLAFGLRARRMPAARVRTCVEETAALLGLSGCLDRRPATLSGGQRQRVALGRALARRPGLLLLDEPLSNLDAPLRVAIRAELIDLHRRLGLTTILVTHDQAEALALGDHVAVLIGGRLIQVGPPAEVYERPATRAAGAFIGSPPMTFLPCEVDAQGAMMRVRFVEILPEDGGTSLQEAGPWGGPLRRAGPGRFFLGIRAEDVRPATAEDDPGNLSNLPVLVRRLESSGHEVVAALTLGPHALSMRLPASHGLCVGDRLSVRLDLTRAVWFSAEGRRLE